jgi:hypothetical protein
MPNMALIAKSALEYTQTVLAEYPEAGTSGLGVSVALPNNGGTYTVTLTPAVALPAPEEMLLVEPDSDTEVSNPADN